MIKMYIGIRNNKVWDICDPIRNKRMIDDGIPLTKEELNEVRYFFVKKPGDIVIGDTWENDISLKDSPLRIKPERKKSRYELLEARIKKLEGRL